MLGLANSLSGGIASMGSIPSDIEGLDIWLQFNVDVVGDAGGASNDSDMADAEDINSWADQSGNSRHASQDTAAHKPHWETDAADLGGLKFTAGDHHLNLASNVSISANQDFTAMMRVKITDISAASALYGDNAQDVLKIASGNNKKLTTLIGGSGASSWEEASATIAQDTYYIITLTRSNGDSGTLEMRVHGGSHDDKSWDAAEENADADAFTISNIGSSTDSALNMHGVVKDFMVWKGTALTTGQRNDMYDYILGQ